MGGLENHLDGWERKGARAVLRRTTAQGDVGHKRDPGVLFQSDPKPFLQGMTAFKS